MKKILFIFTALNLLFFTSQAQAAVEISTLQKGLVAHYPLDQESLQSATIFADKTPNENAGTSANTPVFTTDRMGQSNRAMSFNGTTDKVSINMNNFSIGNNDCSISVFIKTDNTSGNYCQIVSYGTENTSNMINLGHNDGGVFISAYAAPQYLTDDFSINDGAWHSLIFVLDSQVGKVYIDGVIRDSRGFNPNVILSVGHIGVRAGGGTQYFNGSIADVRIYNRAITQTEITALYEQYRPKIVISPTFKFTVQTTGANETFTLPLEASGVYAFNILWGDGKDDRITAYNDPSITHTYTTAGTHTIQIKGDIKGWSFNNSGDKAKIYDIKSWGQLKVGDSSGYFYGCSNLTVSATDILDVSETTDFFYAFRGCSSLTTLDVSNWNTAAVTSFSSCFRDCSSLTTLDVSNWNTAAVTSFYSAFRSCTSLTTLDVSNWNTAAVTNFYSAFRSCSSLTTLDVSNWNTAAVTSFSSCFRDCTSLTTLDVSNWNTAAVTSFSHAFYGCSSLTTLALNNLNVTAVTTMENMLASTSLTTANYSDILIAFEAQAVLNNVPLHGGGSKYSAGAAATARGALISDHNWSITDGGQE